MNSSLRVAVGVSMLLSLAGCTDQESLPLAGQGEGYQSPASLSYISVEPIAVTSGLARGDSSGITMNFTYRYEDKVRLGFLRSSETGMGRIFCPTIVATAIKLGEQIEVSYEPGSNPALYDDLVVSIRYRGKTCPVR
ncbi:MAG: hypothetical protein R3228_02570 [Halioglobus sp.]|nr:hypothetical protein [Halioglobus sp.]